jgi:glycosyltransferase involved in cell wall biosynthesis
VEFPDGTIQRCAGFFRRLFVRRASAYIAYGSLAKDIFQEAGRPGEKIFIALNTVDTEFYAERTQRLRLERPAQDTKRLLFVGYLEPRKNVENLIAIVKNYPGREMISFSIL